MNLAAVILAAGSGTRLNAGQPSEKPKVMYPILGRPMVAYTVELLRSLRISAIFMVVGHKAEEIQKLFGEEVQLVLQEERKGTAHAAKIGEEKIPEEFSKLLIIQGDDSAFYKKETIENFIRESEAYKIAFTTVKLPDPGSFGRVVRNENGEVTAIIEKEATTKEQKLIEEVNAATYLVDRAWFNENYPKLRPSKVGKGELIMTDLIEIAFQQNEKVLGFEVPQDEWVGVNTPEELERANQLMKERQDG